MTVDMAGAMGMAMGVRIGHAANVIL
jgi:hypothetical protein